MSARIAPGLFPTPTRVGLKVASATPLSDAEVDGLVSSGLQAHGGGRLLEAGAFYQRALAVRPNHPDALNLAGVLAFQEGDTDQAIRLIEKAVKAFPAHRDAYLNLAEAFEKAKRHEEAIAALRRALTIEPDDADAYVRLAAIILMVGKPSSALSHANVAAALEPDNVTAHRLRGEALRRLARYRQARESFDRALELDPANVKTLSTQGDFLNEMDFAQEAEASFRRALAVDQGNLESLMGLAAVLQGRNRVSEALVVLRQAMDAFPADPEVARRRAIALRDSGDFGGAEAGFRATLEEDPDNAAALYGLARMSRLSDTPEERARLTRLTSGTNSRPQYRVVAGFALGELLDRANEPDAAFRRFAEANALHKRQRAARGDVFDADELQEQVTTTETVLAPAFAEGLEDWGNPTSTPVFIVGLPRSGTSLVEQICASHSLVTGAGELRLMESQSRLIASHNTLTSIADWDSSFSRARADEVAAEFERIGAGAARVIDKTPLNLLRLGMIGALLPNARVIWCRRDPRDTVVSLHLTYFARGNAFSTDLADCAFAVRQIERIGEVWKRQGTLRMLEVSYEDLVGDLETNARRIIDHLGLDWEPGVLDFQRTKRTVATPSSWQVRQPVYSSAVGRWRRYEKHLGPMFKVFDRLS